jgi:hypothetical protein
MGQECLVVDDEIWIPQPWQYLDGDNLLNRSLETHEGDRLTGRQIYHPNPAKSFGALRYRHAAEYGALAHLRQANEGVAIAEVEATREAGSMGDGPAKSMARWAKLPKS